MTCVRDFARTLLLFPKLWLALRNQRKTSTILLKQFSIRLSHHNSQRLHLYGLYIPVFIGESYSILRGRKLSFDERAAITYLGSMTGLFDDLFDSEKHADDAIRALIHNTKPADSLSEVEQILLRLFDLFQTHIQDKKDIESLVNRVFESQVQSRKQIQPLLTTAEIKEITFNKGGYTMQLYRRAFAGNVSEAEDALFFNIGAIGQLENDIFDIYNDFTAGISTLATISSSIQSLRDIYADLQHLIFRQIENLDYNKADKRAFKCIFALITARGLVALDNLAQLENRVGSAFNTKNFTRQELICDMEKPKNWVKLLHYASKCSKK
ncbi:MAG: hypothetical protein ACOYM7_05345 [Paludibacter sp.]